MALKVTKGISTWQVQGNNVERLMDNAAYSSAHPEDTLVLAGPPRFSDANQAETTGVSSLLAIGMLQTFQVTSQKPTQPMMAIGSGRTFYVSGKSQSTWRVGRLLTNGRNLLRVLYHNAVAAGLSVENFGDPVVPTGGGTVNSTFYINLDSELYYVPFGLGIMFKDKADEMLGAFYCELCMIQMYTLGFTAGQNMVLEDVSGLCDRLFPFSPVALLGETPLQRQTLDAMIGFTDSNVGAMTAGNDASTGWVTGFGDNA
jgi:hypothetical protein